MTDVTVLPIQGLTLAKVEQQKDAAGDDEVYFYTSCGRTFCMFHDQNCCESVTIEDIDGDLMDLCGKLLLVAEERTSDDEVATWTFYTFRTNDTTVSIRWYGTSNGYYSERVAFKEVTKRG